MSTDQSQAKRRQLVQGAALPSLIVAIVSLAGAVAVRVWCWPWGREVIGFPLLALWIIGPPVFYWYEWVLFSPTMDVVERDRVKHVHDLASKIWLGLVVVLAGILEIVWK